MKTNKFLPLLLGLLLFGVFGQSGGGYDLSHNAIASGGGSNSAGGTYLVDGTVGQSMAGAQSNGGAFSAQGGFWPPPSFAPTAAGTSISGRVAVSKYGIMNAILTLTNVSTGEVRMTLSSSFGYYRFDDVPVGESYFLQVRAKRHVFSPDSRSFSLVDELVDVDFIISDF